MKNLGQTEMISVVCTVYNAENYIEDSIQSVLNQTYKNIEIIMIDDGSTDQSVKIIEKFISLQNFTLIKRKHTGNVGRLLNDAIKIATGKLIAIMSADDIWLENRLEEQMKYIPQYEIICSNAYYLYEDNEVFTAINSGSKDYAKRNSSRLKKYLEPIVQDYGNDYEFDFADLLRINNVVTISILGTKKALLDAGGFDEEIGIRGEDYHLWLNYAKNEKSIKFINKPLVKYRVHQTNLSFSSYLERKLMLENYIEMRSPYCKSADIKIKKAAIEGCSFMFHEIAKLSFSNKDYNTARLNWIKFMKLYNRKLSFIFIKYLLYFLAIGILSILPKKNIKGGIK